MTMSIDSFLPIFVVDLRAPLVSLGMNITKA